MKPFEEVVREHGPTVLRMCRAVLGPELAEDAWSETFLAALRAYPDLPADSNIQAWLVTIAKRKAIDQHRARLRAPAPTAQVPDIETSAPAEPDGHDPNLHDALAALPRKQREAIAYHHIAGLPYTQIADLLDTTATAARRAAADGMKTLRSTYTGVLA